MDSDQATSIAISALQYLAGDAEQLSRFVALTGLPPDEMRSQAGTPEFLAAVLDFFLGNEPTLLAFAASSDLDPADIGKARYKLVPPDIVEGW